jgi:hypothetical protein
MDEFVFSGIEKYQEIELKAVNKTSASEDLKDESAPDKTEELKPLIEKIKTALGASVKDVRASVRLADSPSCIVLDEDEPGDQLPGIRTLAEEIVVSHTTVAKAYSELEHEGLLEVRHGSGATLQYCRTLACSRLVSVFFTGLPPLPAADHIHPSPVGGVQTAPVLRRAPERSVSFAPGESSLHRNGLNPVQFRSRDSRPQFARSPVLSPTRILAQGPIDRG